MAHFRGTLKGNRGEKSSLGDKVSGLVVTCNGWDAGVRVEATSDAAGDCLEVWATNGSNDAGRDKLVCVVRARDGKSMPFPHVSTCEGT